MKYLILLTLSINTSLACQLSIPESYVPTFLNPPVSGHYQKCDAKPEEQCLCIDNVNPWYAELVDNIVLDYVAKSQEESCVKTEYSEEFPGANLYQDCDDKFAALKCKKDSYPINSYKLLEVYCATDVMKVNGKKLVESESKKAQYEALKAYERQAKKDEIEAKQAMKQSIKEEIKTATTVTKLRALVEKLIEAQE